MAKKTEISKIKTESKKLTQKVLKLLDVVASVDSEVSDDVIKIDIEGDDLGLLIGYRGENVESLQLILGVMLNRQLGSEKWVPVLVDVGGWRQQREESLRALVKREIENMAPDQLSVELPTMPPAQRRSVHLLVSESEGLESESVGEGADRRVVIKRVGE
jgi:spoIIIJ-associated protein